MNNLFDPSSRLGAAFNDIFAQATPAQPQQASPSKTKAPPPVARIGAARPFDSKKTAP